MTLALRISLIALLFTSNILLAQEPSKRQLLAATMIEAFDRLEREWIEDGMAENRVWFKLTEFNSQKNDFGNTTNWMRGIVDSDNTIFSFTGYVEGRRLYCVIIEPDGQLCRVTLVEKTYNQWKLGRDEMVPVSRSTVGNLPVKGVAVEDGLVFMFSIDHHLVAIINTLNGKNYYNQNYLKQLSGLH